MSRTKHGSKGPGFDYWGRRITKNGCGFGITYAKRLTHKLERRAADRECYREKVK